MLGIFIHSVIPCIQGLDTQVILKDTQDDPQRTGTCVLKMPTQTVSMITGRDRCQPHVLQCAGLHTVNRRRFAELVPGVVGMLGAAVVDESPPCDD